MIQGLIGAFISIWVLPSHGQTAGTWAWLSSSALDFDYRPQIGILFQSKSASAFERIDIFLSEPLAANGLELETCPGFSRTDALLFSLNQGEWVARMEKDRNSIRWPSRKTKVLSAISIQLKKNEGFCLKSLALQRLVRGGVEKIPIQYPESLSSQVEAQADGWISWKFVQAAAPLAIWAGDRFEDASSVLIRPSPKVASVELPQHPGLRLLEMPLSAATEFKTTIAIWGLLVRGVDGQLRRVSRARPISTAPQILANIFHRELRAEDEPWTFRFRRDQSFFIQGAVEARGLPRRVGIVGTYSVDRIAQKSVRLSIDGYVLRLRPDADHAPCAHSCLPGQPPADRMRQTIEIEEKQEGRWIIRNRTPKATRILSFRDINVRAFKEDE